MISSGSMKTVAASSKETLCFLWLRRFLLSSHSTSDVVLPRFTLAAFLALLVLLSSFKEKKDDHAKSKISGIGRQTRSYGSKLPRYNRQECLSYPSAFILPTSSFPIIIPSVCGNILRHQGQS